MKKHLFTILRVAVSVALLVLIAGKLREGYRDRVVIGERVQGYFISVRQDNGRIAEVLPSRIIEGEPELGERVRARIPGLFWGLFSDWEIEGIVAPPRSVAIRETVDGKTRTHVFDARTVTENDDGQCEARVPGIATSLRQANPWVFAIGFVLMLVLYVSLGLRWWFLMRVQGITITPPAAVRYNWIGIFFNSVLPGLTGGDLVKMYYMVRQTHKKAAAVATIILDRIVGLVGMGILAIAAVSCSLGNPVLRQIYIPEAVYLFMGAVVLGALVFYSRRLRALFRVEKIIAKLPFSHVLQQFDQAVFLYRFHRGTILGVLVQSIAMHVVNISILYLYGRALGITQVTYVQYLLLVPIIFLMSSLPISLSGLGVREAFFGLLFGLMGAPVTLAVMLSLVFWITQVTASLPGGLMYALRRDRVSRRQMERTLEEEDASAGANAS